MYRQSFHRLATAAALLAATTLSAEELPPNDFASALLTLPLRGLTEECLEFGTIPDPFLPESGVLAPSFLVAARGQMGFSQDMIAVVPECTAKVCDAGVILGYFLANVDAVRFEFRLVGTAPDTQVTVGLLNYDTDRFDPFDLEVRPADVGRIYTATMLPVGQKEYRRCGWVEIAIDLELGEAPEACDTCGTDAISIRDITLGPT